MVLWLVDRFLKLPRRHHLVILVTVLMPVLAPVVFPSVMSYVECLWVRVAVSGGAILVWAVFVVVVVSKLVERDMSEASLLVAGQVEPLAEQVRGLEQAHSNLETDFGLQMADLEMRTQSALQMLGVDLPPRAVNIRFTARGGCLTGSAGLEVSGGSMWSRILGWFRRARRRAWQIVWGTRQSG